MRSSALERLDTIAERTVEILNITSRENGLYDRLLGWFVAPLQFGDRALGSGLSHIADNWTDVSIDSPGTHALLFDQGYPPTRDAKGLITLEREPSSFPDCRTWIANGRISVRPQ